MTMTSIDISDQRVSDWLGFMGDYGGQELFHTSFESCTVATAAVEFEDMILEEFEEFIEENNASNLPVELTYTLFAVENATKHNLEVHEDTEAGYLEDYPDAEYFTRGYTISIKGERFKLS